MANPASLLELFGDFVPFWPPKWIKRETGFGLGTADDLTVWLADLDRAVSISDVRPGSAGGRIGLHAKVGFDGSCIRRHFSFVLFDPGSGSSIVGSQTTFDAATDQNAGLNATSDATALTIVGIAPAPVVLIAPGFAASVGPFIFGGFGTASSP